jgi:hypothetical protein
MTSHKISRIDPELEYLILLTRAGLKPLSRWEAGLGGDARRAVEGTGLFVDTVERRTRLGRRVHETVFARRSRHVDAYRKRYDKTRLKDAPEDARYQGQLFGYPSCCVSTFIERPYTPNGLARRDQEILFHWACPSCNATPGLVREYRRAGEIWGNGLVVPKGSRGQPRTWTAGAVGKVAASLALAAGTTALATIHNPHHIYVPNDPDSDGFSIAEEMRMGTDWIRPDTDGDGTVDGVQLGTMLVDVINQGFLLNVHEYPMCGLVTCEVCGEDINMGYIDIENDWNGQSMRLYYIDLHALENGCTKSLFTPMGPGTPIATKVIDLAQLKRLLLPQLIYLYYPHTLPVRAGDTDGDGLTDDEETILGTSPSSGLDGSALAEDLLDVITQLPRTPQMYNPYMLEYEMDGMEQCEVCGGNFNMGSVEFVGPLDGMSVMMPYVALHSLAHGGFTYDGTVNDGEVLPLALRTVLTAHGTAHWVAPAGDTDDDGLTDAEEAFFGMDAANADEDGTERPDGHELAVRMAAKISSLPEGPLPSETYVVHNLTKGHYDCLVCGEPVNMGAMDVVDPVAGKSVSVPYYNHHFMEKGSYSTDRDDLYPRVDPTLVGDVTGITSITGVKSGTPAAPFAFVNAPNPFAAAGGTQISLSLAGAGRVEVSVYDVKGRLVRKLFDGETRDSELDLRWDGRTDSGEVVSAGVYFCRARFGQVVVSRKMTMVR